MVGRHPVFQSGPESGLQCDTSPEQSSGRLWSKKGDLVEFGHVLGARSRALDRAVDRLEVEERRHERLDVRRSGACSEPVREDVTGVGLRE